MANYEEARLKLTNTQLNKLKSVAKSKAGRKLRITKKNLPDEKLPHELFLTTRQISKITNTFTNNMSTDIKLSKSPIFIIIQSGAFISSWLGKLGKNVVTDIAIPFAKKICLD